METEYKALIQNHTWQLVPSPADSNIIGCCWIYKLKYKPDDTIDQYKARLIAHGFTQTPSLDYFETFSPMVKASIIRIVFAIAIYFQWPLRQLDI